MSKTVKAMLRADIERRYTGQDSACVVDLTGMNVHQTEVLRTALRQKSARLEVVKNSVARRALAESPLSALGDSLSGPCALVTTSESIIDTARVLVEMAGEFDSLGLKQAMIEGDASLVSVLDLAKMKGRLELLGDLAGLITAPARALAGCMGSPQAKIAGCLEAMVDKAA